MPEQITLYTSAFLLLSFKYPQLKENIKMQPVFPYMLHGIQLFCETVTVKMKIWTVFLNFQY